MTKIALVNLADPSKKLGAAIKTKIHEIKNIVFVDYTGDETNYIEEFHNSLKDKSINIIWFLCGGINCIKTINLLDWSLVSKSKAIFLGSSDITHFFLFFPDASSQKFYYFSNFIDFQSNLSDYSLLNILTHLKKRHLNFQKREVNLDLESVNIVGGHSIISSLFTDKFVLSQTKENYYFWEHHGNFESTKMYQYWLEILNLNCKNLGIKNVILGESLVYKDNRIIDSDKQYQIAKQILIDKAIYCLDQTKFPIPIFNI